MVQVFRNRHHDVVDETHHQQTAVFDEPYYLVIDVQAHCGLPDEASYRGASAFGFDEDGFLGCNVLVPQVRRRAFFAVCRRVAVDGYHGEPLEIVLVLTVAAVNDGVDAPLGTVPQGIREVTQQVELDDAARLRVAVAGNIDVLDELVDGCCGAFAFAVVEGVRRQHTLGGGYHDFAYLVVGQSSAELRRHDLAPFRYGREEGVVVADAQSALATFREVVNEV